MWMDIVFIQAHRFFIRRPEKVLGVWKTKVSVSLVGKSISEFVYMAKLERCKAKVNIDASGPSHPFHGSAPLWPKHLWVWVCLSPPPACIVAGNRPLVLGQAWIHALRMANKWQGGEVGAEKGDRKQGFRKMLKKQMSIKLEISQWDLNKYHKYVWCFLRNAGAQLQTY